MLDDYPVHVLTTVMKSFFRELPEPLLTFELFDDFLRGSGKGCSIFFFIKPSGKFPNSTVMFLFCF